MGMSKEEAIQIFNEVLLFGKAQCTQAEFKELAKMSIKALKQESVLDKLRAEIWNLQYGDEEKSMTDENRADAYNNAIRQVIEIIDKYKSESENT